MPVLIPAAVTQMAEPKQHCKATVPQLNIKKKLLKIKKKELWMEFSKMK